MCSAEGAVLGAMGAATVYSAIQTKKAGKSQEAYYQYMASLSEKNREEALVQGEENAYYAQEQGIQTLREFKDQKSKFQGTQKASLAAAGIQGVTAEDIITDSETRLKMDEIAIQYNTELAVYGAKRSATIQGQMLTQQAAQYGYQGAAARIGSTMASYGTLLSGGAQTALTGYQMNKQS
jgi:hypothetical protein